MDTAAVLTAAIVEAQRSDRRIKLQPKADASLDVFRPEARSSCRTPIRKDCSLHLFHERETVFQSREEHVVAAELIVTVAAQRVVSVADAQFY